MKTALREVPVPRPAMMDLWTLGLFSLLSVGMALNIVLACNGKISLWVAPVLSLLLLNCTFTVWHEAIHGTIARDRIVNDVVGYLAAWVSMIPFFKIREVHWQHHQFTNDPVHDPDYWFIDGPFWRLPFRYVSGIRRYGDVKVAPELRSIDTAGQLALLGIFALAWRYGCLQALLIVWLAPKIVAMLIHAWYVNYLPHRHCAAGQFTSARVVEIGWLQPIVLFHNYHGLHHVYQTVPWHNYRRIFERQRQLCVSQGMPVVSSLRLPRAKTMIDDRACGI